MKNNKGSMVRTFRGETLDMAALVTKNEKAVALGNAKMNARGDILGRGGKVLKSREKQMEEYYASNPRSVEKVSIRKIGNEAAQAKKEKNAVANQALAQKRQEETEHSHLELVLESNNLVSNHEEVVDAQAEPEETKTRRKRKNQE